MNKLQSGQSLIEVTVAAAALAFGLVAVTGSLILTIKNHNQTTRSSRATVYNQAAIENFKNYRLALGFDSFYDEIRADGINFTYCLNQLPQDSQEFTQLDAGNCPVSTIEGQFVRSAQVSVVSPSEINFKVTTSWLEAGKTVSVFATHVFYDY